MLIDNQNREHFKDKTRGQINHIVSGHCKTESCAEVTQAKALHALREIWTPHTFKLKDIAHFKKGRS